ncbi:MAG: ComEC/Rec2 family competence protein, partial [Clostridia bacterium]|nr:ComEC/Rec2 family competence protein [Clostridia bacterium]
RALERPPDPINMLTLSAALQMLYNPYVLINSSFLMSYGAACGIYWIAPVLAKMMPRLKMLVAGISVQVLLTPLMLYLFGTVSLCGMFLTLLASVPAGVLCGGGYLFALLSFLPSGTIVCQWIAYLLHALSKFLLWLAMVGARLPAPIGQIRIAGFALWFVVFFYALILFLFLLPKWWKRIYAGAMGTLVVLSLFSYFTTPLLRVLVIDVGQGNAALVRADGYVGLVDTGDGSIDLTEVLYAQSVTSLDFLILTHGHSDHIGGLSSVLDTFSPKVIYMSENQENGLMDVRRLAEKDGIFVCPVSNYAQVQLGSVVATFIVAEEFFHKQGESAENNASLNVHFDSSYGSILLCGDLETEGEKALRASFSRLSNTDILLVPHHGSKNGCTENLLSNILPEYAIISVGLQNAYGHPAQETIARLEDYGIQVYRTDTGGGISITVGAGNWFRKRGIEICQTL